MSPRPGFIFAGEAALGPLEFAALTGALKAALWHSLERRASSKVENPARLRFR
jgi:hypothetical protein